MGKHSNGPWTFEDSAHIYDADAYPIAVMLMDSPRNNMQANAALISAAPDLLQALETLLNNIAHGDDTQQAQIVAFAAIARARGQ